MKRAKPLRTLEELWDLEDRYPLADPSAAGLFRWMFATGMLGETPGTKNHTSNSSRRAKDMLPRD